jgi:hypothetical protein
MIPYPLLSTWIKKNITALTNSFRLTHITQWDELDLKTTPQGVIKGEIIGGNVL